MLVFVTAEQLRCCETVLSSRSIQDGQIDPTRLTILMIIFSTQEEASRGVSDDRPSVSAIVTEKKTDSSGNHNKVKVMATQLLAKFEENAPVQTTGLKRQV